MDLSVNKLAKHFLHGRFNEWYSEQVADQFGDYIGSLQAYPVNLTAAAMSGGKWLVQMYEYILSNPQVVANDFHKAVIPNAINDRVRMSDSGNSSRDPEIISDNSDDSDDSAILCN